LPNGRLERLVILVMYAGRGKVAGSRVFQAVHQIANIRGTARISINK
jgi:hypothetical protein